MRSVQLVMLAAVLVGCDAAEPELGPCEGGGSPGLEIGLGIGSNFFAYQDGEQVFIENQGDKDGISLALAAVGVDAGASVTALVRVSRGGGPTTDLLGQLNLSCSDDVAYTSVFAALEGAESGQTWTLDASVTDTIGRSAQRTINVTLK